MRCLENMSRLRRKCSKKLASVVWLDLCNLFVNQIDNTLIQLSSFTVLVWLLELRLLIFQIFENVGFIGLFKKKKKNGGS